MPTKATPTAQFTRAGGQTPGRDAEHAEQSEPAHPLPVVVAPLVGRADDPAEAAADRMADTVLARLASTTTDESSVGRPTIARRTSAGQRTGPIRQRMEQGFGRSFSGVRLHDDAAAGALAASMSAQAFTTGSDIFLGATAPHPEEPNGAQLMAHELAHVVQGDGTARRLFGFGEYKTPDEEKQIAEEAAQKRKEKEEKTEQKSQDRATGKARKKTVKESESAVTSERKRLSGERKQGVAAREVIGDRFKGDDEKKNESGGAATDLTRRLEHTLEFEKDIFYQWRDDPRYDEQGAADEAYKWAWLNNPDQWCPRRAHRGERPRIHERSGGSRKDAAEGGRAALREV